MQRMRDMHERMMKADTSAERQRLMNENMKLMQGNANMREGCMGMHGNCMDMNGNGCMGMMMQLMQDQQNATKTR